MEFSDGFVSNEHRELHRSATESADPSSVSPLHIGPKSPRSPKSPKSPRSPKVQGKTGKASSLAHDKHSHSPVDGRPKKGKLHIYCNLFFGVYLKVLLQYILVIKRH